MRRCKSILFLLAAVLWLPLSAHCQLEKISSLGIFSCAIDDNSSAQDSDCDGPDCCPVEKAQYRFDHVRIAVPTPDLLPLFNAELIDSAITLNTEAGIVAFPAVPQPLPKCWQFVFRTASSPRAPSLVS